jgi:hypothetical protein
VIDYDVISPTVEELSCAVDFLMREVKVDGNDAGGD